MTSAELEETIKWVAANYPIHDFIKILKERLRDIYKIVKFRKVHCEFDIIGERSGGGIKILLLDFVHREVWLRLVCEDDRIIRVESGFDARIEE